MLQAWAADPANWSQAEIRKSRQFVNETITRDRTVFKTEHMILGLMGKEDCKKYVKANMSRSTVDDIGIRWFPFQESTIDKNDKRVDTKNFEKRGGAEVNKAIDNGPGADEANSLEDQVDQSESVEVDEGEGEDGGDDEGEDGEEEADGDDDDVLEPEPEVVSMSKAKATAAEDVAAFLRGRVIKQNLLPTSVSKELKALLDKMKNQ